MNWTKEVPTLDGWYWIRTDYSSFIDYVNSGTIQVWCGHNEKWQDVELDMGVYEFYGPLEEPK